MSRLILASGSTARATILRDADVAVETDPADLDEQAMIAGMQGSDAPLGADDIAEVLAEAKAVHVSNRHPGATVIGADQTLALGTRVFQKPASIEEARRNLLDLAGKTHSLHASVAVARDGARLWSYTDTAQMTMRAFSPQELGRYLAAVGDEVLGSVGCYRIEGRGIRLFESIDGSYWTILGMPLLPLLDFLRKDGVLVE